MLIKIEKRTRKKRNKHDTRLTLMWYLIKCEYCNKENWYNIYTIGRKDRKFCSRECAREATKNRIKLICVICNKEFEVTPARFNGSNGTAKCCSWKCFQEGLKAMHPKDFPRGGGTEYRGRYITNFGYITISKWELTEKERKLFSSMFKGMRVFEHRIVMARHLGRPLISDEVIHHIDKNKQNNSLSNLQLLNKKDHSSSFSGRIETEDNWNDFLIYTFGAINGFGCR